MTDKKLNNVCLFFSLIFLFFFFSIETVFTQTGVSLETEIKNIEKAVQNSANSEQRRASLVRLANLRQLSGDIEGAARNWLEAAAAIPGTVDDNALLSCALCLAAMGEWDRASAALEPLIVKNIRASFLSISIKAIKTGDTSMLDVIANNPEYSEVKREILFLLWKISRGDTSERWRSLLVTEFPQSLEGSLAASKGQLTMSPNPFWFFISGLDSLPLLAGEQRTENREQIVTSQTTQSSAKVPETSLQVQTGVFSREANAQSLAANLRQAGFSPSIEQRVSNNTTMWAVTIPAGADATRTIANLRASGFDGFLVR